MSYHVSKSSMYTTVAWNIKRSNSLIQNTNRITPPPNRIRYTNNKGYGYTYTMLTSHFFSKI